MNEIADEVINMYSNEISVLASQLSKMKFAEIKFLEPAFRNQEHELNHFFVLLHLLILFSKSAGLNYHYYFTAMTQNFSEEVIG